MSFDLRAAANFWSSRGARCSTHVWCGAGIYVCYIHISISMYTFLCRTYIYTLCLGSLRLDVCLELLGTSLGLFGCNIRLAVKVAEQHQHLNVVDKLCPCKGARQNLLPRQHAHRMADAHGKLDELRLCDHLLERVVETKRRPEVVWVHHAVDHRINERPEAHGSVAVPNV